MHMLLPFYKEKSKVYANEMDVLLLLRHCSIAVKRHQDQGNSYTGSI